MKNDLMKYLLIFLSSCILILSSWANADQQNMENGLKDFTRISLDVKADVYIKKGPFKVELKGDKKITEKISLEVKKDELTIKYKNNRNRNTGRFKVYVSMPDLDGLAISGSGRIFVQKPFTGKMLNLAVSGNGDIELESMDYKKLACSISGSGSIYSREGGKVDEGKLNISGSGQFKAEKFNFKKLDVNISGSGDCYASVQSALDVKIIGSGTVNYFGSPDVKSKISGSGKVRKS